MVSIAGMSSLADRVIGEVGASRCERFFTSLRTVAFNCAVLLAIGIPSLDSDLSAQSWTPQFQHLRIEDGLSQTTVRCIVQDFRGFMWFGTQDGLNRFDGYEVELYEHDSSVPGSISSNDIMVLYEDSFRTLWIGTAHGLNRYDRDTDSFDVFRHDPHDSTSLSSELVTALYEGRDGVLWVGTNGGGLNSFDRATGTFRSYRHDDADSGSLSSDAVDAILQDRHGRLIVGTDNGLNVLDAESGDFNRIEGANSGLDVSGGVGVTAIFQADDGSFWIGTNRGLLSLDSLLGAPVLYSHDPDDPSSLGSGPVSAIVEDSLGNLWVGVDGGGVSVLTPSTGQIRNVRYEPFRSTSLSDNSVRSIHADRSAGVWIGTTSRGADRYDPNAAKFTTLKSRPDWPESASDHVRAILLTRSGDLWVGTEGEGLSRFSPETGATTIYRHDPTDASSLYNDKVFSLQEDSDGEVWVGTLGGGFSRYLRSEDAFVHYSLPLPPENNVRTNSIRVIHEDGSGRFWIATQGGGVLTFDRRTGTGRQDQRFRRANGAGSGGRIFALAEGPSGKIWVGSFGGGLEMLDPVTGVVSSYTHIPDDPTSLSSDRILSVYPDIAGRVWIGSAGGGLDMFDPVSTEARNFDRNDGLPSASIYGMLEDENGCLWLAHNNGLSRFDPTTEAFENYDVNDGLQSNEFNAGAVFKSRDGAMFFGGIVGYNVFFPDSISDSQLLPHVVITDLQIHNRSVPIGPDEDGRSVLDKAITETDGISLSHRDRVVSFEYAALLFGNTDQIEYAHMLEGLEDDWNYVGSRRFATYTHIPPGRYVFRVKASNGDGVWNETGTSVRVTLTPPFWKAHWFLALAGMCLIAVPVGFHQYRTRMIRIRADALEESVRGRTAELEQEIAERREIQRLLAEAHQNAMQATKAKSEFLANMSHEIRTPMNGVLGMTQLLLESDLGPQQRDHIDTIHASGEALLTIINDILDISKIEAGKLDIEPIPFDLQVAASEVADLLAPKASEKGLEFVVRYSPNLPRYLIGDAGRLRQIMLNLTGNAIKFTSDGHVLVEVEGEAVSDSLASVKISIHDTGIGMDDGVIQKLFQPFVQADSSTTRHYGGTGLGLAISRQLIELMDGELKVESAVGKGTTFWFTLQLPLGPADGIRGLPNADLAGVRVLIVDDVELNRRVLSEQLQSMGMITETVQSGSEALARLRSEAEAGRPFPIAILDFLMPNMDGEELGRLIREDESLKQTALVLLTSAGNPGDGRRLKEAGFDAYLVKPARPDTLRDVMATVRESVGKGWDGDYLVTRHSIAEARAVARAHEEVPAPDTARSSRRALVAEDNIVNQKVAKKLLEKLDCVVDVAANGEEAVDMWSRFPYDLVFMDCQMPELDGYEATSQIRRLEGEEKHTPIIAMTANAMDGDREQCLAAGMDDYLPKPVRIEDCRAVLDRWIGSGSEKESGE